MNSRQWVPRASRRVVACIAAVAVASELVGCGASTLSLTGGSIPIGTASIRGVVVRADAASQVLSGASVLLSYESNGTGSTDSNRSGGFAFTNIGAGSYWCTLSGQISSGYAQQMRWPINVATGTTVQVLARALPTNFDATQVKQIALTTKNITMHVGDSTMLAAVATGSQGQPLTVQPTIQVLGGLGTLAADGTFTATATGTTRVEAWLDTAEDDTSITIQP